MYDHPRYATTPADLVARRTFLSQAGLGLGTAALASLMGGTLSGADQQQPGKTAGESPVHGKVYPLHFAPRAKRVIFLYMSGGPSHLDLFDYKPELARRDGEPMP